MRTHTQTSRDKEWKEILLLSLNRGHMFRTIAMLEVRLREPSELMYLLSHLRPTSLFGPVPLPSLSSSLTSFHLWGSKAMLTSVLCSLLPDIQSDNVFCSASAGVLLFPSGCSRHFLLKFTYIFTSHILQWILSNSSTLDWFHNKCFSRTYYFLPVPFLFELIKLFFMSAGLHPRHFGIWVQLEASGWSRALRPWDQLDLA